MHSLSRVRLSETPQAAACQASLSITDSWSSPKPMPIESVMASSHLILSRPLILLPPIPSSIKVLSNDSALRIRWPKYCSFSFSISPSNEHPGLISNQDGLVRSPCSPRHSQESSPAPQFKSINSSVLSFLYSPTLTSIQLGWGEAKSRIPTHSDCEMQLESSITVSSITHFRVLSITVSYWSLILSWCSSLKITFNFDENKFIKIFCLLFYTFQVLF